jgi:hypothetical protein
MYQRSLGTIGALAVFGLLVTHAKDSSAFFSLTNGIECVGSNPPSVANGGSVVPDQGNSGGIEIIGSTLMTFNDEFVVCPFTDSTATPDTSATGLSVDVYNPTASTMPASTLSVSACVFSSWTHTCGTSQPNAAVSAGGHAGIFPSISVWTADTGHGYAFILLDQSNNNVSFVAGVHYF